MFCWKSKFLGLFKSFVALISNKALKCIKGYNFWKSSFPCKTTISKEIPCLNIQKKLSMHCKFWRIACKFQAELVSLKLLPLLQSLDLRPCACKQASNFLSREKSPNRSLWCAIEEIIFLPPPLISGVTFHCTKVIVLCL